MAINTSKVVVGGLVAGVVMNVIDFVINNFILKDAFASALNAVNPSLAAKAMTGSAIAVFVISDFLFGLTFVWLYAAIRPRFGPGPKTAVIAGIAVWAAASFAFLINVGLGFFSWNVFLMGAVASLINALISANVGAMLYKEEATPA